MDIHSMEQPINTTMNALTIREIFEKANLSFDPLYIKYLLKNTGHYRITTKLCFNIIFYVCFNFL